jgi:peptidoglycan hydrolase-like protein with peptidoglycan-binding domain
MTAGRPLPTIRGKLTGAAMTGALLIAGAPQASAASPAQPSPTAASAASTSAPSMASVTSAAFEVLGFPVLRQGPNINSPEAQVRSLQYLLRARGASVSVDGVFGPRTRTAVVAFQRSRHLVVDGVAGTRTWRALIITVRLGSRGDAVRAVQDQINFRNLKDGHSVNVDGIFGPRTRSNVIELQRGFASLIPGSAVDGIVGPDTWQMLISEALSG